MFHFLLSFPTLKNILIRVTRVFYNVLILFLKFNTLINAKRQYSKTSFQLVALFCNQDACVTLSAASFLFLQNHPL